MASCASEVIQPVVRERSEEITSTERRQVRGRYLARRINELKCVVAGGRAGPRARKSFGLSKPAAQAPSACAIGSCLRR